MNVITATLGGLLHDIGKFAQRGQPGRMAHTEAGGQFYARCLAEKVVAAYGPEVAQAVEWAIRGHHEHAEVISLADHIAAGERFSLDEEDTQDPRETPLIPIWHGVTPEGTVQPDGPPPATPLAALTEEADALFPQPALAGSLTGAYAALWREFEEAASLLPTENTFLDECLSLLERFTWCVPSAAYRSRPDISLFDHLRLTAAVAACLSGVEAPTREGVHFVLLLGDLSGIQSYLFALGRTRAKGAAKRLRARSHRISQLAIDTAREILRSAGLFSPNLVMSAGGKFYLLLPANPATIGYLDGVQGILDERCARDFGGLLSVRLAWVPCSGVQLCDFGPLRQSLEAQVRLAKARPLAARLQKHGRWDETAFVYAPYGAEERPCPICGLKPVPTAPDDEAEGECDACRAERIRGAELARTGIHHVPRDPDGTATDFKDLASQAAGRKYLAVLKADVDHLGRLFDRGLAAPQKEAADSRITLSRIVAASRSLEWFFSRWLPHFLRTNYPHTYTIYAGGDDLLLVGPWNTIIDLAEAMESRFRRYVAGNPHITWSAGITLCTDHTPINLAVESANRYLMQAKDTDALGRDDRGRNQVTCLGTILPWDRFHDGLADGRQLGGWARDTVLSASMLQTLMWAGRQVQRFRRTREVCALRWVPHLAYQIGRLAEPKDELRDEWRKAFAWLVAVKEAGLRDLPADCITELDTLRLAADYAAYLSWRESDGE